MTPRGRARFAAVAAGVAAAVVAVVAVAGCGGAPAVRLSDTWPETTGDYAGVTKAWTRHGRVRDDFDTVLDVTATFKSPEWRAAYVARRVAAEQLDEAGAAKLRASQQADAAAFHEVELLVSTYNYRENDLQKGDKSMWRIVLVDDQGRQTAPAEIVQDRRPGALVAAEFPAWQPFHRVYVLRFPRSADVLHEGAKSFSLRIASVRGIVALTWAAP